MTETNEQWLAKAITFPIGHNEKRYYYDKQQSLFFEVAKMDYSLINGEITKQKKEKYEEEGTKLLVSKLLLINSHHADIIEIPRLNREERVAIQTEFIENIDSAVFYNELAIAINKQDHTTSFVLDKVLNENKKLNIFIDYWWEFKFTRINYFINDFEEMNDLDIKTVKIRSFENSASDLKVNELTFNIKKISKKSWWRFW